MGFRFRRSIKIIPGVRVNIGKRGFSSVSIGRRGLTTNYGKKGTRTTIGLPGTGLSYSTYTPRKKKPQAVQQLQQLHAPALPVTPRRRSSWVGIAAVAAAIAGLLAFVLH